MPRPTLLFLALCAALATPALSSAGFVFNDGGTHSIGTNTDFVTVRNSSPAPGNPTTLNVLGNTNVGVASVYDTSRIEFQGGWANVVETHGASFALLRSQSPTGSRFFATVRTRGTSRVQFSGGPLYVGNVYGYDDSSSGGEGEFGDIILSDRSSFGGGAVNIHGTIYLSDHATAALSGVISPGPSEAVIADNSTFYVESMNGNVFGDMYVYQSDDASLQLGRTFRRAADPYQIFPTRLTFQDTNGPSGRYLFYYGDIENVFIGGQSILPVPTPPALALALSGMAAAGLFRLTRRLRKVTANC